MVYSSLFPVNEKCLQLSCSFLFNGFVQIIYAMGLFQFDQGFVLRVVNIHQEELDHTEALVHSFLIVVFNAVLVPDTILQVDDKGLIDDFHLEVREKANFICVIF